MSEQAERRRHPRTPLRATATFWMQGEREGMRCELVDFCPAGLFLALDPSAAGEMYPGQRGLVQVVLAPTAAGLPVADPSEPATAPPTLTEPLQVEVRRVSRTGIGVCFVAPKPQSLAPLASMATLAQMELPQGAAAGPDAVMALVADLALPLFQRAVEQFLVDVDNALLVGARDARSHRAEQECFATQSALKQRYNETREAALAALREALDKVDSPFLTKGGTADPDATLQLDSLTLVDKEAFESFLVVSEAIADLEPLFRDALFALNARFSALTGRTLDNTRNPIGPSVLCQCVATALPPLPASQYASNCVFKALVRSLRDHLPNLYRSVNARLIEEGVLPHLEREKHKTIKRPAEAPAPAASRPASGSVGLGASADTQSGMRSASIGQGAAPGYFPDGVDDAGNAPQPMVGPPVPGFDHRANRGRATGGAPDVDAGYLGLSSRPVPANVLDDTIGDFARTYSPPTFVRASGDAMPATFTGAYAAAQRMSALRQRVSRSAQSGGRSEGDAALALQPSATSAETGDAVAGVSPGGQAPANLLPSKALLEGLGTLRARQTTQGVGDILSAEAIAQQLGDGLGPAAIPGAQLSVMEIVAELLRTVVSDMLVGSTAKRYLTDLQFAVQREALTDEGFFKSAQHPARQVIDRVARVNDTTLEDAERRAEVERVMARMQAPAEAADAGFSTAVEELDSILERQSDEVEARVADVVSEAARQHELMRARRGHATATEVDTSALPPEWHRWLKRAKALRIGEYFIYNNGRQDAQAVSLAWVAEDFESFVFVNATGQRIAAMPLQQVAMFLRRELLKPLLEARSGAMDRAVGGLVSNMHSRLEQEVAEDSLTHFLHLSRFLAEVDSQLDVLPEEVPRTFALIDLRGLREVNQEHGRVVGDALLNSFADSLRETFRAPEILFGRLSGDKLALFQSGDEGEQIGTRLAPLLHRYHVAGVEIDGVLHTLRGFAGVTAIESGVSSVRQHIGVARALCKDISPDSDQYVFTAEGREAGRSVEWLKQLATYLERALRKSELTLTARTVLPLKDGLVGCREIRPAVLDRQGRVVPSDLVRDALKYSARRAEFDKAILAQTLQWMVKMSGNDDRLVVVPLSAESLADDSLPEYLMQALTEYPVPPGRLCFLLKDEDVVEHLELARDLSLILDEFGCRFALDNFGSGHSDYSYLRELVLEFVVIRDTFVDFMHSSERDAAMVRSISELAGFTGIHSYVRARDDARMRQIAEEMEIDYFCPNSEGRVLQISAGGGLA